VQKVVYVLLKVAFLLSPRNSSTIGHRDLVGVGDRNLPVSCILIARRTIPCDMASSAKVASAELHLTILHLNNCPSAGLLHNRLLSFHSDSAGGLCNTFSLTCKFISKLPFHSVLSNE
jgi:hypothetical protein